MNQIAKYCNQHQHENPDYDALANALREIDQMEDVLVTVWQGRSRLQLKMLLSVRRLYLPLLLLVALFSNWKMVLRVRQYLSKSRQFF